MHKSLEKFIKIVDNNFKGNDDLLAYVLNKAPKYGKNDKVVNDISDKMIKINYDLYKDQKNYRNGNYQLAYRTMTNPAGYGKITRAMPYGRKANEAFYNGISLVPGIIANKEDLTIVADLFAQNRIDTWEFLTYNPSGIDKLIRLGKSVSQEIPARPMTTEEENKWIDFFYMTLAGKAGVLN